MRPEEIALYRLNEVGTRSINYVGYRFFRFNIRPRLNDPQARALTDNKWIFYQLARAHGLPIPRTLALYDPRYGVAADGSACSSERDLTAILKHEQAEPLVIKPSGGIQGQNVLIFENIDYSTGRANLRSGATVNIWEEIRKLPETRRLTGFGYVVQEGVSQHRLLSRINPYTVNTARVVTYVTTEGDIRVPFAIVRLGRAGKMVDNWAEGGVSVGVDVETGQMRRGVFKPKYGGNWVSAHPDTGVTFTGLDVPNWSDTVDLCLRAARLFPGVRCIGWDIVIGNNGPVLLEANENWDLIMVQVHTDGWLSLPGVRDDLSASGVELPNHVPSTSEVSFQILKRQLAKLVSRVDQAIQRGLGPPDSADPTQRSTQARQLNDHGALSKTNDR